MVKINRRIAALAGVGAVTLLATPVLAPAVPRKRGAGKELHDATTAALANTLGYATVDALKQAQRSTFLVDLAADKGISSEQLEQAKRAAAQPILDRLVNEETLTRQQADQLLERLARVVTPSPTARAHQAVRRAMHEAVAKQLGYSNTDALNKAVQDGVNPRALIQEKGSQGSN